VEEQTIIKTHELLKTRNEGRPSMTPNYLLQQLLPYIEDLWERGNAITATTVTLELLRMAPNLLNVGFIPLHHWVPCFLKKHHYTFCVVTHKAQNHHYHAMVIDDGLGTLTSWLLLQPTASTVSSILMKLMLILIQVIGTCCARLERSPAWPGWFNSQMVPNLLDNISLFGLQKPGRKYNSPPF